MRWPAWIHDALRLGPREVERVRPGLPEDELAVLRRASAQPDEAVELLLHRLSYAPPAPRRSRVWMGIAAGGLAVAAALVLTLRADEAIEYGELTVEEHTPLSLSQANAIDLGPSIVMSGLATVSVEQADASGTVVRVERGSARFRVDPEGPFRALTVLAADARVQVTGTEFIVHRLWDSVHVDVLRGSVLVDRDGRQERVAAGSSWSHEGADAPVVPSGVLVADTPPPAPTTPDVPSVNPAVREPAPRSPSPVSVAPLVPVPPVAADTPEQAYSTLLDALDAGESGAAMARSLDAFLQRWPDSPMAPEARALQLEIAADLESAPVVLDDVEAWLEAWPGHPRRLAMLELAATLARDRMRDCARALPAYRALAVEAPRTRIPHIEGLRGLCALELGDRLEAREALRRSVELGVDEPLATDVREALAVLGAPVP